jgi:hypothetical protein
MVFALRPVPSGSVFDTARIEQSFYLDGVADYLSFNPATNFDDTDFTVSMCVQFQKLNANQVLVSGGSSGGGQGFITMMLNSDNRLYISSEVSGGVTARAQTSNMVFEGVRPYHIVWVWNTTHATDNRRSIVYVNGEEITWSSATYRTQNDNTFFGNPGYPIRLGATYGTPSLFLNALVSQFTILENGSHDIADFGESLSAGSNGLIWAPKPDADMEALANTTGGYSACLTDEIGDGTDASGLGNDWTPTSVSHAANGDVSTPSLIYPRWSDLTTFNSNGAAGSALYRGPAIVQNGVNAFNAYCPQFSFDAGDLDGWCWEMTVDGGTSQHLGIMKAGTNFPGQSGGGTGGGLGEGPNQWGLAVAGGHVRNNGTTPLMTAGMASGSVVTFVLKDGSLYAADDGQWWNGTSYGESSFASATAIATGLSGLWHIAAYVGSGGQGTTVVTDEAGLSHQPSGTKVISSATVETPSAQGADNFVVVRDTEANILATLAAAHSFTNRVDILKNADSSEHWLWRFSGDASNEHQVDGSPTYGSLTALSGSDNWNGYSIQTGTGHAYQETGVSHTNGAATTITHGLGTTRVVAFLFNRAGGDVWVYHPDLTSGHLIKLNSTDASSANTSLTNVLTNSIDIGASDATGTYDVLALAEGDVWGFAATAGTGLDDGPYVDLGFSPAWLLMTCSSFADASHDWFTMNNTTAPINNPGSGAVLKANEATAQTTEASAFGASKGVLRLSNGVKIATNSGTINGSGRTNIFVAAADVAGGGDLAPVLGR